MTVKWQGEWGSDRYSYLNYAGEVVYPKLYRAAGRVWFLSTCAAEVPDPSEVSHAAWYGDLGRHPIWDLNEVARLYSGDNLLPSSASTGYRRWYSPPEEKIPAGAEIEDGLPPQR